VVKRLVILLALGCLPACRPRQSLTLHFLVPAAAQGTSGDPLATIDRLEVRSAVPGTSSVSAPFSEGHHGSVDVDALLGATPETLDLLGLDNGSVLAAGRTFPLRAGATTASVYIGLVNAFAPTPMPRDSGDARYGFTTTPFAGGDAILVADGATTRPASTTGLPVLPAADAVVATLAVYDATSGAFVAAGADLDTRIFHAAVAAGDGSDSVLLIGGFGTTGDGTVGPLADVVRVTRDGGSFRVAPDGTLPAALWGHTATALDDGSGILIVGGYTDPAGTALSPNAYLYRPGGGGTTTLPLTAPRAFAVATDLHDNGAEVLITGGLGPTSPLDDALVYQPTNGRFVAPSAGGGDYRTSMLSKRVGHSATLLADGHVLVAGGFDGTQTIGAPEVFDPVQPAFIAVDQSQSAAMLLARQNHQAVALADGSLLLFGGETATTSLTPLLPVERLVPATGAPPIGDGAELFAVLVSEVEAALPHPGALGGGVALGDQSILYLTGAGSASDAGAALLVPCNGACLVP
jgi:hypothetical protein